MRRLMLVLVLLGSSLGVSAGFGGLVPPAFAEEVCHTEHETVSNPRDPTIVTTEVKEVCVEVGISPASSTAKKGEPVCYATSGSPEIPCRKNGLIWFASQTCYAMNVTDVPRRADDPDWEGRQRPGPGDGVWACVGMGPDMTPATALPFIVPGGDPAPVDPEILARQALNNTPLVTPTINMAPRPPLMSYVGLETWLWTDRKEWAELTGSASAGATTVAITAEPVRVSWDLTDGTRKCTSPGRAWVRGMDDFQTTDCFYVFKNVSVFQPDGTFPVTSTIIYRVDWTCTGTCLSKAGTLGDEIPGPTAESAIRVSERQSVVVRGGS